MIFKPAFSRHFLQLDQFILEVEQLLSRFSTDVRLNLAKWKTSCPPSVPQLLLSTNFFQKLIFMSFNATFPVDPYGQSRNLKALYLLSDLSLNPLDQLCPWPGASLKQFLLRICRIFFTINVVFCSPSATENLDNKMFKSGSSVAATSNDVSKCPAMQLAHLKLWGIWTPKLPTTSKSRPFSRHFSLQIVLYNTIQLSFRCHMIGLVSKSNMRCCVVSDVLSCLYLHNWVEALGTWQWLNIQMRICTDVVWFMIVAPSWRSVYSLIGIRLTLIMNRVETTQGEKRVFMGIAQTAIHLPLLYTFQHFVANWHSQLD